MNPRGLWKTRVKSDPITQYFGLSSSWDTGFYTFSRRVVKITRTLIADENVAQPESLDGRSYI